MFHFRISLLHQENVISTNFALCGRHFGVSHSPYLEIKPYRSKFISAIFTGDGFLHFVKFRRFWNRFLSRALVVHRLNCSAPLVLWRVTGRALCMAWKFNDTLSGFNCVYFEFPPAQGLEIGPGNNI